MNGSNNLKGKSTATQCAGFLLKLTFMIVNTLHDETFLL